MVCPEARFHFGRQQDLGQWRTVGPGLLSALFNGKLREYQVISARFEPVAARRICPPPP